MNIKEIIESFYSNTYDFIIAIMQPIYDLLEKFYLDNPMFKIVLEFVPAILAIAYPLVIQTISKLNDQYKSTHIIDQFKKEFCHKYFLWNLRISVFLTILCFVLSIEVYLLAFISLISLLISFFFYLQLLLRYQNGKDLFNWYLSACQIDPKKAVNYNRNTINKKKAIILGYWHPIIDIYLYAIRRNDRKLEYDIRDFYIYRVFSFIRFYDQKDVEEVVFPPELYNSSFDIVYNYIKSDETDYYQNIEVFVGSIYFSESFGKEKPQYFHQDTIKAIWRNLILLVEHGRGDKIVGYWQAAHQYFSYHLRTPYPEYDDKYNETKESIDIRNKIHKYQDAFIQLHTALGAYLMFKRDCKTLKEIWFFTQSQPPVYVLIPQTPNDIFHYFFKFIDFDFYDHNEYIYFWFRGLEFDKMNNRRDVKFVISEYLVLLFLRLYITTGFYGSHPITFFPELPLDQSKKKRWQEKLIIFQNILERHLEDKELMNCLGLSNITRDNCSKDNLKYPLDYVEELKQNVEKGFKKTLEESELDPSKIAKLDENTVHFIEKAFNDISRIKGQNVKKENQDNISKFMEVVRGTRMLLNKEAFISNTSVHHLNADAIIGEIINKDYYSHFASKISQQHKSIKLNVANGEAFLAIEKLNPDPEQYVILSFGFNIKFIKQSKNIAIGEPVGDEDYTFRSIPIYCFDFGYSPIHKTIILLKKSDLPMIAHRDWSEIEDLPEKTQERWKNMTMINSRLKIYRRITDLNLDEILRNEYLKEGRTEEELKNMLEIDVDFLGYIWFRNDVKIIEIKEGELFQEGGMKDNIEMINQLE